jgi:hypothetical protein
MIELWLVVELFHRAADTRPSRVPGFELHDIATGALDARVTGRAQSATCLFCRKTLVTWPARARLPRARTSAPIPQALRRAEHEHTPACAEAWMWALLARWAIGHATELERRSVETWREIHFAPAMIGVHHTPPSMADIFERLPQPPSSQVAQELEVALIAISRLWSF